MPWAPSTTEKAQRNRASGAKLVLVLVLVLVPTPLHLQAGRVLVAELLPMGAQELRQAVLQEQEQDVHGGAKSNDRRRRACGAGSRGAVAQLQRPSVRLRGAAEAGAGVARAAPSLHQQAGVLPDAERDALSRL